MQNVIAGLNARRVYKGWSWQFLADMVHKDVTTVKRQLSEKAAPNLTLATIDEYLRVLGGWISYETDESVYAVDNADVNALRLRLTELGMQNDSLRDRLAEKDALIAEMRSRIERLEASLIESNRAIARKDSKLSSLIDSLVKVVDQQFGE